MSWITVIWSMNAGACLALAASYGAVWSKQRENRVYLARKEAEVLAQQQRSELERLRQQKTAFLGGSCEVHTGASKGTTVYCRVPLEAQPSLSTIS